MRASGMPSLSTVASVMALPSAGSDLNASLSHSENSANGSSAAVKSPDVNEFAVLLMVVSVMRVECPGCVRQSFSQSRTLLIGDGAADTYRRSQGLSVPLRC